MFKEYTVEHIDGVTIIRLLRRPTYGDVKTIIDDVAKNFPYHKRLWDFCDIVFDFTMDEIKGIAAYGKTIYTEPNWIAVVAPNDLSYGEMRAFEVYREQEGHSEARAFRNRCDALEWLDGK